MKQKEPKTSKKGDRPWYPVLSNVLYFHKLAYREMPRLAVYHICLVLGNSILPFFGILMPGIVLRMAQQEGLLKGLLVIAGAGAVVMICEALRSRLESKKYFYENTLRDTLLGMAVHKGMKCLYKYVEYGEARKVTRQAYNSLCCGDNAISYAMLDLPRALIINVICFCLYSTVLSVLSPWLVALMLFLSLLNYGILCLRNRWQRVFREEFAQSNKKVQYLNNTFSDVRTAKDMRVYGMNQWLMNFRHQLFADRMQLEKRNNRRVILADFLQQLLTLFRNGFAYAYLIYTVLWGEISAADFLVYFGAITGFSGFVNSIVSLYSSLKLRNEDASCFRAHMELPEVDEGGEEPPELFRQPAEIVFRDVSFSYGGEKVYEHFHLKINPGEKVALLGINGAGKTTLVKLLCGLYEPEEGQILINGVDIATLSKKTLYRLFSVVFQENTILPYPVGCNLSYKRLQDTDEKRAWEALEEAGLAQTLREKGVELDTFMTKNAFEDGLVLSGGQTQKLLLARAIYKNGNILILDEPTSALDPIAESEIYQEYVKISRGRTSLFISHRLASTKFSDRILFLEDGRIKEEGTHQELMELGGSYAHMYEVQSHYYKENEVSEDAG